MKNRNRRILGVFVTILILFGGHLSLVGQRRVSAVVPANVVAMENLGFRNTESGYPASVPRAWGRLAAMQDLGNGSFQLVFESGAGELYFVLLVRRGNYLYLDTRDKGGVVTVLTRD